MQPDVKPGDKVMITWSDKNKIMTVDIAYGNGVIITEEDGELYDWDAKEWRLPFPHEICIA